MKRPLRLTAACLVAACLGSCATEASPIPSALPPLSVPQVQAVRGVSLREVGPPALASAVVPADSEESSGAGATGIDQYPTMHWMLALSGVLDEIGDQPVTILAPSESAFRDFEFVDYYGLMSDPVAMAPILRRHVVLGAYDVKGFEAAGTVTTLAGEQLVVWLNGRQLMVNEATLTPTNDGVGGIEPLVVYEIDRVLLLPEASAIP